MKIDRKVKVDLTKLDKRLAFPRKMIGKIPQVVTIRRDNLIDLPVQLLNLARLLTWEVQTPEIEKESTSAIVQAAKMLAGFHQIAQTPEQKHTISIASLPSVTWSGEGILESGRIHCIRWCEAYFAAVIARDTESMDVLANFPVEIMKNSATKSSPVYYLLIEVFKAYHYKEDNILTLVDNTMAAAMKQGSDWALNIAMGYLETFAALTTDIGFDFNEKLAKNLVIQEKHWMNALDKDVLPVDSFIPLELLGMACMWHDKGNKVTVESDSLPRFLIEGTHL